MLSLFTALPITWRLGMAFALCVLLGGAVMKIRHDAVQAYKIKQEKLLAEHEHKAREKINIIRDKYNEKDIKGSSDIAGPGVTSVIDSL